MATLARVNSGRAMLNTLVGSGIGIPVALVSLLAMMVLPLPPLLLDVLFTFNISLSIVILLASIDARLAFPMLAWFVGYVAMLRYFVPRMRDRSRATSEARSALTGRVVDSYTNILTVKLFARARDEDDFVREADRGGQAA